MTQRYRVSRRATRALDDPRRNQRYGGLRLDHSDGLRQTRCHKAHERLYLGQRLATGGPEARLAFVVVQSRGLSEELLQVWQLRNFHCHLDSPDLIGSHERRELRDALSVQVGSIRQASARQPNWSRAS
jgi:hypothetical protein